MKKRGNTIIALILIALISLELGACGIVTHVSDEGGTQGEVTQENVTPESVTDENVTTENSTGDEVTQDGAVTLSFRTHGKSFQQLQNGEWKDVFLRGVNIGAGKPGFFPGELGITKEDYQRWFGEIAKLGADVVRVYTILTPDFYFALKQYNETAEKPLYFMQGVYNNEEDVINLGDVYADDEKIVKDWENMCRTVVDVVHGDADIERVPGSAGGVYNSDVSEYLCGWIHGIEWAAEYVTLTNENNPGISSFDGEYVKVPSGSAFEVFLARGLESSISYETEKYGMQHPTAFVNWVTTDPMEHLGEPNREMEDAVSLDPEHFKAGEGFQAGFFASYHVYPYYPEMMRYDPELQEGGDPYLSYLKLLNAWHTMPVIISEFGVPASRGMTHLAYDRGFTQGWHTEKEQGETLVSLLSDIRTAECAGAFVFIWQDEWFKRTWNTAEFTVPEERAYWSDMQTSEQNFGLMAFDPGEEPVCLLDGKNTEWQNETPVAESEGAKLYAKCDARYLYLMLEGEAEEIGLDIIPGQGAPARAGADFLIRIKGKDAPVILVDPYYDTNYWLYSRSDKHVLKRDADYERKNTGRFMPIYLMLNRHMMLSDGEVTQVEEYETGKLRYGSGDPASEDYDSLSDLYRDEVTELRIPWLLINIPAPNARLRIADLYAHEEVQFEEFSEIGLVLGENRGSFTWEKWKRQEYRERLKDSYYILQSYLAEWNSGVQ